MEQTIKNQAPTPTEAEIPTPKKPKGKKKKLSGKIIALIVIAAVLLITFVVGAFTKPDAAAMEAYAAENSGEGLKEAIAKDNKIQAKIDEILATSKDPASAQKKIEMLGLNTVIKRSYIDVFFCSIYDVQDIAMFTGVNDETFLGIFGMTMSAKDNAIVGFFAGTLRYVPRLLNGAKITLMLTTLAVAVGFILSIFLALGKISKSKIISKLCGAYIFFFRGTPLMMQLFCIYYAIPGMIQGFGWGNTPFAEAFKVIFNLIGVDFNITQGGAFFAAFVAFALNSAAYCAEIVRAAILSIDKGQHEAAKALGFTKSQTMWKIIIPQTYRRLVPPLANEFIMVVKDASLISCIAIADIMKVTQDVTANGSFLIYIPAMAFYLIITGIFTYIFNRLEKYFSKYD